MTAVSGVMSDQDVLEEAARERWGDAFRIERTEWNDGTSDVYAIHVKGRNEDGLRIREKMGVYDGEIGIVRELCEPEPVVDEEILLDPTSEEEP